jgi:MerR family transcriptional regulator/heat shock protein HspR
VINHDERQPVYVISVAAQLSGMHPQTLRQYDRLGIVSPSRTGGGGRRYSAQDLYLLQEVARLSQEGLNLEGIKRVIALEAEVLRLREQVAELAARVQDAANEAARQVQQAHASHRRDLVPVDQTQVVVWRRR